MYKCLSLNLTGCFCEAERESSPLPLPWAVLIVEEGIRSGRRQGGVQVIMVDRYWGQCVCVCVWGCNGNVNVCSHANKAPFELNTIWNKRKKLVCLVPVWLQGPQTGKIWGKPETPNHTLDESTPNFALYPSENRETERVCINLMLTGFTFTWLAHSPVCVCVCVLACRLLQGLHNFSNKSHFSSLLYPPLIFMLFSHW